MVKVPAAPGKVEFSVAMVGRAVNLPLLMKCDSCDEKATVFYTQVAEGKLKKFSLCESCAESKGITSPESLMMPEELLGSQPATEGGADLFAKLSPGDKQECPSCGFTLANFRKVGRLGCPSCYRAFSGEIAPRLPGMHKGNRHTGYWPEGMQKRKQLESDLADLRELLETAIQDEQYEEAASLRDRIQELEGQGKGPVTS